MNLLESLKAAKAFLNVVEKDPDYKTDYICFAIYDAFAAKYGLEMLYTDREIASQMRKAKDFIVKRLCELQTEHGLPSTASFSYRLAVGYLVKFGVCPDTQVARHLWLDSLIKELEDAESN